MIKVALESIPPATIVLRRGGAFGWQGLGLALGFAGVVLIMGVEAVDGPILPVQSERPA